MLYKGQCHCGKISYEVEGEVDSVMECNCSICTKKGHLLWFVPREKLRDDAADAAVAAGDQRHPPFESPTCVHANVILGFDGPTTAL